MHIGDNHENFVAGSYSKMFLMHRSDNIIASIEALRARGTEFLDIPDTYYRELKRHLANSKVQVKESLDTLQKLKILIDYDDDGYLLQVCFCSVYLIS